MLPCKYENFRSFSIKLWFHVYFIVMCVHAYECSINAGNNKKKYLSWLVLEIGRWANGLWLSICVVINQHDNILFFLCLRRCGRQWDPCLRGCWPSWMMPRRQRRRRRGRRRKLQKTTSVTTWRLRKTCSVKMSRVMIWQRSVVMVSLTNC